MSMNDDIVKQPGEERKQKKKNSDFPGTHASSAVYPTLVAAASISNTVNPVSLSHYYIKRATVSYTKRTIDHAAACSE